MFSSGYEAKITDLLVPAWGWARKHTWVVETSRDAVGVHDLAICVLNQVRHAAMQHPWRTLRQGGGVLWGVHTISSCLDTYKSNKEL